MTGGTFYQRMAVTNRIGRLPFPGLLVTIHIRGVRKSFQAALSKILVERSSVSETESSVSSFDKTTPDDLDASITMFF
jgi:hypothetical protein